MKTELDLDSIDEWFDVFMKSIKGHEREVIAGINFKNELIKEVEQLRKKYKLQKAKTSFMFELESQWGKKEVALTKEIKQLKERL